MSALVIGANGYIGFAIAQHLRQNGYKVYGLIRKEEHSHLLASNEIIPVIGDATNPSSYENIAKRVENIVDASSSIPAQAIVFDVVKKLGASAAFGKKVFINTSGILTQGHSTEVAVSEEQTANWPALLNDRAKLESDVIASKEVHGIVIRPGFVYGYAGGNGGDHLGDKAFQLSNGKIQISGSPDKRYSWVHVNDLARAYLLAIQKFTIASGQIFNIANRNPPTYLELRKKAAEIAGHKNPEVVLGPVGDHPWAKALEISVIISPKKAENLLGWFTTHETFLDDLPNVYVAYQALKKSK